MSGWARPGVKCVCVDGSPRKFSTASLPVEGKVYTIASVEYCVWLTDAPGIGVHIAEISRPPSLGGKVMPWTINRFRPLVQPPAKSQSEDVALFTDALTKVGEPA